MTWLSGLKKLLYAHETLGEPQESLSYGQIGELLCIHREKRQHQEKDDSAVLIILWIRFESNVKIFLLLLQ